MYKHKIHKVLRHDLIFRALCGSPLTQKSQFNFSSEKKKTQSILIEWASLMCQRVI